MSLLDASTWAYGTDCGPDLIIGQAPCFLKEKIMETKRIEEALRDFDVKRSADFVEYSMSKTTVTVVREDYLFIRVWGKIVFDMKLEDIHDLVYEKDDEFEDKEDKTILIIMKGGYMSIDIK